MLCNLDATVRLIASVRLSKFLCKRLHFPSQPSVPLRLTAWQNREPQHQTQRVDGCMALPLLPSSGVLGLERNRKGHFKGGKLPHSLWPMPFLAERLSATTPERAPITEGEALPALVVSSMV